ncbi:MAG: hypothetical protein JWM11_1779, partial [Planctomycetaceae bacterium]|nr:hypothetical protein [Planctomycetaceae bacterium]
MDTDSRGIQEAIYHNCRNRRDFHVTNRAKVSEVCFRHSANVLLKWT